MKRKLFLAAYERLYAAVRPLIFRSSAAAAHEHALRLLARLDASPTAQAALQQVQQIAFPQQPVHIGGVVLPFPLILAAGFVKGSGFPDESAALTAVRQGENIIPGWRAMPALVGPVEFGSFTRWPRPGNPGTVLWRDAANRSTQNRIGLKNPGAQAAAAFLGQRPLPPVFGINIAVSPGVSDPQQEQDEVLQAIGFFQQQGIRPAWLTLNISCPNTEDDPGSHQTESRTRQLCQAVRQQIDVPLWVKISPDLASEQYRVLFRVFADCGIDAVIATNTLGQPTPDDTGLTAGVAGARLHRASLNVLRQLVQEKAKHGYTVDIVGCGGVQDGHTLRHLVDLGLPAAQYWSALIFRGPLAAALILNEVDYV